MAKPSLLDLVNAALATIGQASLKTLDDDEISSTAAMVRAKLMVCKREVLRSNDWNCARVRATLQENTKVEKTGWAHAFNLPKVPECLRIVQISIDGGETFIDLDEYYNYNSGPKEALFDLDKDILLCNAENVCIKYTADIDPIDFDASLASAFVAHLASELAYTLPASVTLADYMHKVARLKMKSAKSLNARERNIIRPEGEVISTRYGMSRSLRVDMSDEIGD